MHSALAPGSCENAGTGGSSRRPLRLSLANNFNAGEEARILWQAVVLFGTRPATTFALPSKLQKAVSAEWLD
jgi:hypothetical protein